VKKERELAERRKDDPALNQTQGKQESNQSHQHFMMIL